MAFLLPGIGFSQFTPAGLKFYENGQPTRTGADAGMFADTPSRLKIDLSGSWNYSPDGKEWNPVLIPSAYTSTKKVTFQRTFEITSQMLDTYSFSVVCYGINYQSEITINGNFVGRHQGGYSSFVFPIPQNILQQGKENAVSIAVDNELTPKTTLPLRQQVGGWRTYGGIFRDIYILATPRLSIESPEVRSDISPDSKTAKISIHTDISDHASGIKNEPGTLLGFQVEVYDKLTGELSGRSGITPLFVQANKSVSLSAEAIIPTPKLWSPETPDLYIVKCEIVKVVNKETSVIDQYDMDAGIRDIRWTGGKLFIGGSPVLLKGVLWQEDHSTYASAMTYEALEKDIALIKTLGANLVRFQYPPHPYILNLCDRYGLLAMEEIPLLNVPAEILVKDYFQDLATAYIKEMVLRDKYHVSVLAWGIGSEFETSAPNACDYVNAMRNIVKSLDVRPVYFSSRSANDSCFEYVDLIALVNNGMDHKEFREQLKKWRTKYPDKPILVVRYGKEVEPGNRNGYSDPLSMESQARYAMQSFDAMKDSKIAGGVLWSFNDWQCDRPALTTHSNDPYLKTMGIVSYDREKRTIFDVVRALYMGEKVQALPVGNYASSAPIIFVVVGLVVLISFAFIYNGNRRFRDAVNRSLFRTYNFFADIRDQRILTYGHSIFLALIVSVTWAVMLSSILSHYRDSVFLDNMLSQFMSDGIKEWLVRLIWNPTKFILVISGFIILKLFILSLIVRIFSMMVRTHVYFYHAFSITIWSMLPYIIFIPVAMIMFRLMETPFYILPIFILILIVTVWVVLRLLKGISIIYDVFPIKVYAIGILLLILCVVVLYGYYDYTQSTSVYLKYLMQTANSSL